MIKGIKNTAFPYLLLLILIIAVVSFSDRLANRLSTRPTIIQLASSSIANEQDYLWQFEQDNEALGDGVKALDTLYRQATEAYSAGRLKKAETYFVTLLNKYPEEEELYNYLGLIRLKENNLLDAESYFLISREINPDYGSPLINLGILYTRLENYTKADSVYRLAMRLDPAKSRPRLNKGIMHCRIEEWRIAQNTLDSAIVLASGIQKAKAFAYRGMARFNLKDTLAARSDFEEAVNLAPSFILPRIYLALSQNDVEVTAEELHKIIALNPSYAPAHYYLGVVNSEQGRSEDAALSFEKALQLNPGDRDISELLGSFYIENDLIDKAEQYFEQVYGRDTLSPANFFYKAKLASRNEENERALALYDKAIERSGRNYAEAYLNAGILHKRAGMLDEAIQYYHNAIRCRDRYEEAWYNMALTYRAMGEDEKAVECYERALEIEPDDHKARFNLGVVLSDLGQDQKASQAWEETVQRSPDFVKAWFNLGLLHYRNKKYAEAIDVYERMLSYNPGYSKGWYNLALAQKESGLNGEAIASYEKAIDLDPTYVAAWKNLGTLNARDGNVDEAILQYQQAVDIDNSDPQLRFNLALQYEKKGQIPQAIVHLNKAVQLQADYLKAIEKLMNLAIDQGDELLALRTEELLRDLDQDAELTYELGRNFHRADLFNDAVRLYEKAEKRGKNNEWVSYWKAKALEESGQLEPSIAVYREALEKDKTHKFSLYRLSLQLEKKGVSGEAAELRKKIRTLYPDFAKEKEL